MRLWMGCQRSIRVLRDEAPLHKCVSLYMADIHEHSIPEDEKVLLTIPGNVPSSSNSDKNIESNTLQYNITYIMQFYIKIYSNLI